MSHHSKPVELDMEELKLVLAALDIPFPDTPLGRNAERVLLSTRTKLAQAQFDLEQSEPEK